MITLTNFNSGEILIQSEGNSLRLDRDIANRLVMTARMHTTTEFLEKLPALIRDEPILNALKSNFEKLQTSTDRWNFKEKFARLRTLTKDHQPKNPQEVVEEVSL